jgi:hypothetical protein
VRGIGSVQSGKRRRKNTVSIALVVCLSAFATGCSHIDAMFSEPPQTQQKPTVRKAPIKAVSVTPERREQANALHASALDQMGRGAYGPAVSSLAQAAKLDPTNEQIRRDLVRANRMRSTIAAGETPARHGVSD